MLVLPAASTAAPAATRAMMLPDPVMPDTSTVKFRPSPCEITEATSVPGVVEELRSMSAPENPVMGSEKLTVNETGDEVAGSVCDGP